MPSSPAHTLLQILTNACTALQANNVNTFGYWARQYEALTGDRLTVSKSADHHGVSIVTR